MATMTMEPATRAKQIKTVIKSIEQDSWTESLLNRLDELEFERRLEISIEQANRGQVRPARQALKEIRERVLNG